MNKPIVLASTSPRRIEMMGWLGVPFETDSSDFDEKQIRHTSAEQLTRSLAEAKAAAVLAKYPDSIVIGSDAVVSFQDKILEKPADKAHQRQLLHMQKGQEGKVYTSVCVIDAASNQRVTKTKVVMYKMPDLTDEQIENYIASGSGLDKAGGFGLQDNDGLFIEELHGCFSTAMGFPICEVAEILKEMGISIMADIKEAATSNTGRAC